MRAAGLALTVVLELLAGGACTGKLPATRHYQLVAPPPARTNGDVVLVLEPLVTDDAYDDERIVYRTNPYRLDYYHYHHWSAAPGTLVADYLERALEHSGRFRAVVRELAPDAPVILGGRVVAIEEVDASPSRWLGRIVLELTLKDARTGEVLWTEQFEELEPLPARSPEGLARALSRALARITARVAPVVSDLAARQAARHGQAGRTGRVGAEKGLGPRTSGLGQR